MTKKTSRTFVILRASTLLALAPAVYSKTHAAGVAVFKDQAFHSDETAKPVAYTEFVDSKGPIIKINTGKKELIVERCKYVDRVDVLSEMPRMLTCESEIAPVRKSLDDLNSFAKRFPKSAPILQGQISALGEHINKFDSGEIRYDGSWISKEAYNAILEKNQNTTEEIRKQEMARIEKNRMRREKEEAFASEQRSKGLEQYGDKWLPAAEVSELKARDARTSRAWKAISDKTVSDGIYSIFQVTNDGMLIEFHRGKIRQAGVNTDIAFLFGAAKGMAAEGDLYKGTLYWCGTYSYTTYAGFSKTVNAYSLDKGDAIQRVCATLGGGLED